MGSLSERATLAAELDNLIAMLEASLPGNQNSPENQRLISQLEQEMQRYFRNLENAISDEMLEQLYYRFVRE